VEPDYRVSAALSSTEDLPQSILIDNRQSYGEKVMLKVKKSIVSQLFFFLHNAFFFLHSFFFEDFFFCTSISLIEYPVLFANATGRKYKGS